MYIPVSLIPEYRGYLLSSHICDEKPRNSPPNIVTEISISNSDNKLWKQTNQRIYISKHLMIHFPTSHHKLTRPRETK